MLFKIDESTYNKVVQSFDDIANELINSYLLKINEKHYQFIDLEFYYFCNNHLDGFTMEHKRNSGELEAHKYGVDISLGNEDESNGGILIKSLWMSEDIISKSQIKTEIINNVNIGKNNIEIVRKKNITNYKLIQTIRENLGDLDIEKNRTQDYKDAKYRFIKYDKNLFKKLKGKEDILRNSNLTKDNSTALLGYELKK